MSAYNNELTLSEMRVLVSSVVHLDVTQIALCAMTIPKLKHAILDLLGTSSVAGLSPGKQPYGTVISSISGPISQNEGNSRTAPQSQSVSGNGPVSKRLCNDEPPSHNGCSTGSLSNDDMDASNMSSHSEPSLQIILSNPPNPDNQHQLNLLPDLPVLQAADPTKSAYEVTQKVTEISMVGNKIAIGTPGKSKAKTDKRVRYITCRVCHLLFYKRDQYREHMRTHANDPNITIYSCDQCTFVTKRKGVFQTHFLRHTGDLPYKCELCDYAGRQPSLLRQHMVNKHSSDCYSYNVEDVDSNKSDIIAAQDIKEELDPALFGCTETVLPQP